MKIKLYIITILLSVCLILASCTPSNEETGSIYQKLDDMAKASYSSMSVTVTTKAKVATLINKYQVSYEADTIMVEYTEEELTTFEEVNGEYTLPQSTKSTHRGTALIKNGVLFEQSGTPSVIDLPNIAFPTFHFSESSLTDIQSSEGTFTAKVKNSNAVFGKNIDGTNITITVTYTSQFESVEVSYLAPSGAPVTIKYVFS